MSTVKKQGRDFLYAPSLRIAIAREYLTGDLGYGKLAKKHSLKLTTVKSFVKWYKDHCSEVQHEPCIEEENPLPTKPEQKQLTEAHLKIAALEIMIQVASEELGVNIKKKFGTKQPYK